MMKTMMTMIKTMRITRKMMMMMTMTTMKLIVSWMAMQAMKLIPFLVKTMTKMIRIQPQSLICSIFCPTSTCSSCTALLRCMLA